MTTDSNQRTYKLYPSASGFASGTQVHTEYDSGCLRSILIANHGVRGDIPAIYMQVGAHHEDQHAEVLGAALLEREKPIKWEPLPGVISSGRCDFHTIHGVDETKGTISPSTWRGYKSGKWKLNHLAQLVGYLIQLKEPRGRIVTGYYETDGDVWVNSGYKVFDVEIRDEGRIYVDDKPTSYTVADQLRHTMLAAEMLLKQEVAPRPANWDAKWGGPCGLCPYKRTCTRWDEGDITTLDQFIASAKDDSDNKIVPDPKPKQRKKK